MLAAIGETLEKEGDDEVMGVVVNARKGFYRIGLWTKSCTNQEVLKAIGYGPLGKDC
jgi:translation initiation factor 4E